MSHATAKKVFIQIESVAEQQEHLKQQRKTLKVLQGVGTDKENLVGRPELDKLSRLKASATESTLASTEYAKRKKVESRAVHTQTSPIKQQQQQTITAEDLTSDAKPGEHYWERLAEKRREALEETLTENRHLHERIEGLEAELSTSRQELEQTQHLVAVLTEMLEENEEKAEEEKSDDVTDVESAAETAASSEKDNDDNADNAKN